VGVRCAYCGVALVNNGGRRVGSNQRMATRDHILPKCEGGSLYLGWSIWPPSLRVRNWKWACPDCNGLRAACGHCIGAMACVQAVAKSVNMRPNVVLRAWNKGIRGAASLHLVKGRTRERSY